MMALTRGQIADFIHLGFIKLNNAFPTEIADECRALLWQATGCDPHKPETWTQPVIRIGEMKQEPFKKAANTAILHNAFDQLAGKDNWWPRTSLGTFPIRFPVDKPAGDTGWHVDSGFPGDDVNDFMTWRINIHSKGRALLMLFLFSDVGDCEAPTLIRVGSHLHVARLLKLAGEKGLSFMELARQLDSLPRREEALATGKAGTVYLCHPFLVHAAQDNHGTTPKFMAQPPLQPKNDFNIGKAEHLLCPVEKAIVLGMKD